MDFFIDNYSKLLAMKAVESSTQLDEMYGQFGVGAAVTPYIYQQAILAIKKEKLSQDVLLTMSSSFLIHHQNVVKMTCNSAEFSSIYTKLMFNIGFGFNFRKSLQQTQNFYSDYGNALKKNDFTYLERLAYITTVLCVQLANKGLNVDELYPKTLDYVSFIFSDVQSSMQKKK